MKKFKKIVLPVLLLCMAVSLVHTATNASAASFDEKIKQSQERKEELAQMLKDAEARKEDYEKHKQEMQATLDQLQKEMNDIISYIEQLDMELMDVTDRLDSLEAQIAEKEDNLEQVRVQLEEAIEAEEEQYETMKKRIRYLYENGNESIWDMLVNADGLADLLNRAEYRSRLAAYDNTLLERYEVAKDLTATNKTYLETAIADLYDLKEEAEFERDAYLALSAEKGEQIELYLAQYQISEEMLEQYGEQIANEEMTIEEIYQAEEERAKEEDKIRKEEEERIRLEEERRRREEEERRKKEEEARKKLEEQLRQERLNAAVGIELTLETSINKMIWPLPGDGRVYSKFGPRKAPIAGASTYHKGVDIGGEYGAQIVAVLAGTVSKVAYSWDGGNHVIIDHGNGLQTKYLHCSKTLVQTGDFVMQGEVVGLVGSTGVSTGPHLHFGVLINGTHVDPLKYISYE